MSLKSFPIPRRYPRMTKTKKSGFWGSVAAMPHAVWCVLFILAPLAFIFYFALTDVNGAFTTANIEKLFDKVYLDVFANSFVIAIEATAVCLLLAYPLAYFISRSKPRTQSVMAVLIMLPMWVNFLIRTYSLKIIFENNGILNALLGVFGISPVHFLNSNVTIIIGMVYNFLPYMVLPIYSVMTKIDTRLLEAAGDLGCNGAKTLTKVIFPLSVSGVISGITMVFVPSISTFFISQSLSDGRIKLIGDVIEQNFNLATTASYNIGSALSMVLMILILISMLVMNKLGEDDGGVIV